MRKDDCGRTCPSVGVLMLTFATPTTYACERRGGDGREANIRPAGGESGNEGVAAVAGPSAGAEACAHINAGVGIGSRKLDMQSEGTASRSSMVIKPAAESHDLQLVSFSRSFITE